MIYSIIQLLFLYQFFYFNYLLLLEKNGYSNMETGVGLDGQQSFALFSFLMEEIKKKRRLMCQIALGWVKVN